jgi:hypothetical protein
MTSEDDRTIRRYLLQELAEEERKRVEERMMTDDAFFEEVSFAEDELVDEYTRGSLKGIESQKFEQCFLTTPQDLEQINFNKAFRAHVSKATPHYKEAADSPHLTSLTALIATFWRSQRAAAAVALGIVMMLVAVSALLFVTERRRRSEIDRLQAEMQRVEKELADQRNEASQLQRDVQDAQEKNSELERQLADLKTALDRNAGAGLGAMYSVILFPGTTRSSDRRQLRIPPDKKTVEFVLRVPSDDYPRYRAEIIGKGGKSISRSVPEIVRTGSEPRATLRLPAAKLPPGDYEVKLVGVTAAGETQNVELYYFTVVR